jgi:cysteine desulfurase
LIGQAEHRAVLDCGKRLASQGYEVGYLPVETQAVKEIGAVQLSVLEHSLHEQIGLVCLILGNNEIGTFQDVAPLARACHRVGALLHIDATQAVGKIPLDVDSSEADFVSFSAHKFYGPKGVGGLLVPKRSLKLAPQIVGGGQQNNLRSGTLNTTGILGMAVALQIAVTELESERKRVEGMRNLLWERLSSEIQGLELNGPWINSSSTSDAGGFMKGGAWEDRRLPGNLNVRFPGVEGQAIMLRVPELALSSGSACSSADPRPSHVLQAIGLSEDAARSSLRFGIGRFNTEAEIEVVAERIVEAYRELRAFIA